MAFEGFKKPFFNFFTELAENNNKEWFAAHKSDYEDIVVTTCLDFIDAMGPRLNKISPHFLAIPKKSGGSMFRIYRDTRFSKDKSPYKTNAGLQFRHSLGRDAHAPGFYLHLEPGTVFFGGGLWKPPTDRLQLIRHAIDENQSEWAKINKAASFRTTFGALGEGDPLKRPPKGFDVEHPFIDDLKKRSFFVMAEATNAEAGKADFIDRVEKAYRDASGHVRFLCKAVDASF